MSGKHLLAGIVVIASASSTLFAQAVVVSPQRRVNPVGSAWFECTVAARLNQPNEVVVAAIARHTLTDPDVGYGVTLNGGTTFVNGTLVLGVDPGAVFDPITDRTWVSSLYSCNQIYNIGVAYKEPGATTFSDVCCILSTSSGIVDKPLMGITGDGAHVMAYLMQDGSCNDGGELVTCRHGQFATSSSTPTECPWPTTVRIEPPTPSNKGACRWSGWGTAPVALDSGRIVAVTHDHTETNECLGLYNGGLPCVVYSDDDGLTWLPDRNDHPVRVAEGSGINPAQTTDTPYGIDREKCAPAIAVDRETDDVYVAFYARVGDATTRNANTDIYISRSDTSGGDLSFPNNSSHLVHLTDLLLTGQEGDTDWPDQVMPSITVDDCGGVDVVFYDNRNDPNHGDVWFDLYFVRITGYGTQNQAITQMRLTPQSFPLTYANPYLGDYHNMVSAPPTPASTLATIYPTYIAMGKDANNQWTQQNCYMHKILVSCGSQGAMAMIDTNKDDAADEKDAAAFAEAYKLGDCAADLDGDGEVTDFDAQVFSELYESATKGGD